MKLETVNFAEKSLNNHIKYLHYYEDIILFERIARDAKWCNGERTCIGWSIAHFSSCEINGRFRCNLNLIDHLSLFSFDSKKSDLVKLKVLKSIQEIEQGAHNWTYFVKKPDEQRWLLRQNHKLRAESQWIIVCENRFKWTREKRRPSLTVVVAPIRRCTIQLENRDLVCVCM